MTAASLTKRYLEDAGLDGKELNTEKKNESYRDFDITWNDYM